MRNVPLVWLGATPTNESCAQLGVPGYVEQIKKECRAWIGQLKRFAKAQGQSLRGVKLLIYANRHDFGVYYEVGGEIDSSIEGNFSSAADVLYWLEENAPETWDAYALKELSQ